MRATTQLTNVDIFLIDVENSAHAVKWFQHVTAGMELRHCYPQMRSWPTHPQFAVSSVDPDNIAASTFWQVGAALDRDGATVQIKQKGNMLSAIWSKGAAVIELFATIKGDRDDTDTYRSLTDLAQALK